MANGGTVSSFSGFGYDAVGNRTGLAASLPDFNTSHNFSHTLAYTYDQRDELTEETSTASGGNNYSGDLYDQTFAYDLAYNRTGFEDVPPGSPFSYLFNGDNQNTSGGFAYDGSGNPTQYSGSSYAYAYDPEQRLTGIGTNFAAHYDGDGMRDYVTANGTTTYFLYDGSSPVLEETYSASSGTTTIQVADGFADGWRERASGANGGFSAYAFDPQGTLQGEDVNSNTLRTAVNTYVYDGYGDFLGGLHVGTGALTGYNQDPVQFGGQYGYYTDLSTGEVDLTHRYYDPSTGHFLNRDPIGYNGGQNLYAFCGNNPITGSDPSGLIDAEDIVNGASLIPGPVGEVANLAGAGISLAEGDYVGAGLSLAGEIPGLGEAADAAKIARKLAKERKLAKAGEDLFVGTYDAVRAGNLKSGLNATHTPHHAVQNAVSSVIHGRGITINLQKVIHATTETFRRPVRDLPNLRAHLNADVRELRRLLKTNGYGRSAVNSALQELIRQNEALGGFAKPISAK